MQRYTVQFFYGNSYAVPDGTDVEYFDSLRAIKDTLYCRSDFDPYYPCVDDSAEAYVWIGEHTDVTDAYPDYRVYFGPRGGLLHERC